MLHSTLFGALLLLGLLGTAEGQAPTSAPAAPGLPPEPAPPPGFEIVHDVEVGKGGNQTLHAEILRPIDPARMPTHAVIYVHGGGWGGNNKYEFGKSYFLAQHGYLVVGIEYRISTEAKWPAQIEDCKLGVRWLRAHAADYHIDPDHIGVYGHSAGGHLAACLGTMRGPTYEGHGGYENISSAVQAVVDSAGPVDFTAGNFFDGSPFIPEANKSKDTGMLLALLGEPFAAKPETWKDASPITHVKTGDPPFLILHGEKDPIVSPAQAVGFAGALRNAGVAVDLVVVKNGNHGLGPIASEPPPDPDPVAQREKIATFFALHLK